MSHLLDVSAVFDNPIDPLSDPAGRWGRKSPFKRDAFEYLVRWPRTPGAAERILRREAEAGAGVFLRFFFDPRDFWTTFSDGRRARLADVAAELPGIRADFESYLEAGDSRWSRPVVVLTRKSAVERADPRWAEQFLVEVTVGKDRPLMNMHAYLQTLSAAYTGAP